MDNIPQKNVISTNSVYKVKDWSLPVKPSQGWIISIFRNHFFKAEMSRYDICVLPFHYYLLKAQTALFDGDETVIGEEYMVEELAIKKFPC